MFKTHHLLDSPEGSEGFKGLPQKKNLKGENSSSLSGNWTTGLLVAKPVWSPQDQGDPPPTHKFFFQFCGPISIWLRMT